MNGATSQFDVKKLASAIYDGLSPDGHGDKPRLSMESFPFGLQIDSLMTRWRVYLELLFVVLAMLAAFWLRLFEIETVPLGMHGDEANFALDAQRFLNGEHRGIWTPSNLGNPAGYAWWIATMFTIGEQNLTWLRMASVLAGTALVPAVHMLVRQVLGRNVAIPATILMVMSSWLIIQSRIAFPMMLSVLVFVVSAYLIVEAVNRRDALLAALAGAALGCGIYSFKAFLIFFLAAIAATLVLTYLPTKLRKRREPYIFIGIAIIVAAPLLNFYIGSDWLINHYWSNYFGGQVGFSVSSTVSRFVDVLLLAKSPIAGQSIDGTGGVALLNTFSQVAFFFGLATILVFIHHRPYQLLLLGLFIGAAPAVLAPNAESYRYLLGVVFVLIIAAVGVRSMIYFVWIAINETSKMTDLGGDESEPTIKRWVFPFIAAAIVVPFFAFYSFGNRDHFNDWRNSTWGLDWYFESDFIAAMKFVDELDDNYQMVLYSGRRSFNDQRRTFLYPDLVGFDGATEHGGSGSIPNDLNNRNTAFILMGDYIELGDQIKALYPDSRRIEHYSDRGTDSQNTLLYVAYLVGES